MPGIYGDMLLAWPEQNESLEVYDQEAKINGGWDPVTDPLTGEIIKTKVVGVFQNTRGGGIKERNGNLIDAEGCEFWTHTGNLVGKFFIRNSKVYRLSVPDDSDWHKEGGFYRYGVEKVVGNNGTESDNATWNLGGNSFS